MLKEKEVLTTNEVELNRYQRNKLEFVNEYYENENTQLNSYRILKGFNDEELLRGKDLGEMGEMEMIELITAIPSTSKRTIQNIYCVLEKYQTWCMEKGINITNINPMNNINVTNDLLSGIQKKTLKNKFITRQEMYDMIDRYLKDETSVYQSACMVPLLFYGIAGEKFAELRQLRPQDIDWDKNTINIYNENGSRRVWVDNKCLSLLENAIQEKSRIRIDGKVDNYISSEFVFKNSKGKNADMIKRQRVFERVKEVVGGVVTPASLVKSGQIEILKRRLKVDGIVENEDYKEVTRIYNKEESSWIRLKEDFLLIQEMS